MFTLREWRRLREITQAEMASKLEVHINTYQNWETSPEKITISNAEKIAKILNVSMNEIAFTN